MVGDARREAETRFSESWPGSAPWASWRSRRRSPSAGSARLPPRRREPRAHPRRRRAARERARRPGSRARIAASTSARASSRAMARRTGHAVAEASDCRGAGNVAAWFRALLLDDAPLPVAELREIAERLRVALLLAFAPRLRGTPALDEARSVARRPFLASDDLLVATGAVHALSALEGLDRSDALAARDRLARAEARGVALDASREGRPQGRAPRADAGDLAANAVVLEARRACGSPPRSATWRSPASSSARDARRPRAARRSAGSPRRRGRSSFTRSRSPRRCTPTTRA